METRDFLVNNGQKSVKKLQHRLFSALAKCEASFRSGQG